MQTYKWLASWLTKFWTRASHNSFIYVSFFKQWRIVEHNFSFFWSNVQWQLFSRGHIPFPYEVCWLFDVLHHLTQKLGHFSRLPCCCEDCLVSIGHTGICHSAQLVEYNGTVDASPLTSVLCCARTVLDAVQICRCKAQAIGNNGFQGAVMPLSCPVWKAPNLCWFMVSSFLALCQMVPTAGWLFLSQEIKLAPPSG